MKSFQKPSLESFTDLSEEELNSIFKNGIFKNIPQIGELITVENLLGSVSDTMFLLSMLEFANELNIKDQKAIDELKTCFLKIENHHELGSKILLLIEKPEDHIIIKWLAILFRSFLDGNLERDEFLRLCSILSKAHITDLEKMLYFREHQVITTNNGVIEPYYLDHLYSLGLLENLGFETGDISGEYSGTKYRLNIFGEFLLKEVLSDWDPYTFY